MRSVNANLLEINQAKARIKAAKSAGETPKKEDLELLETEVQKAFAIAQYSEVMNIEKFAKHISTHGCVYSRADISAILYLAVDCMREQLLEGKKIRLGDLGDFYVTLSSKGAENANAFSSQNITDVKVQWEPGSEFKTLMADAEFNLVASRAAQAKVLKAIKDGKSSVDLNSPDDDPEGNPGGDNTPAGGGTASGGSSDSTGKDDSGKGDGKGDASGSGSTENPGSGSTGSGGSSTGDGGTTDPGGSKEFE